jgi:hypothetical protein
MNQRFHDRTRCNYTETLHEPNKMEVAKLFLL